MMINQLQHKLSNFWYEQISTRLFPRQKWLIRKIPREYIDIDNLLELTIFECLIYFWENNGESSLRAQYELIYPGAPDLTAWTDEQIKHNHDENYKVYQELKEAYLWAKERKVIRDNINNIIRKAYGTDEFNKVYNWFEAMEKHSIAQDEKHLQTIIKYRLYLWT